ncbi:hypothetical protein PGTUg99_002455 [Puccinia graminis f. sp. tritici]|uniref:Uncharacterized protein n=1 Tax=Puccinia graminis f. sp. tritici TaxID=56615 RepID=A0A5B0N910_PUCGR|nr:hypothetical protein PGTUg99_002455 [Puccinia graminis f. sp. tritici]
MELEPGRGSLHSTLTRTRHQSTTPWSPHHLIYPQAIQPGNSSPPPPLPPARPCSPNLLPTLMSTILGLQSSFLALIRSTASSLILDYKEISTTRLCPSSTTKPLMLPILRTEPHQ